MWEDIIEVVTIGEETTKLKVFRYDPAEDEEPHYDIFEVPVEGKMNVLNALEYIYRNIDSTLAFYSHSTCQGQNVCKMCSMVVEGEPCLACQTSIKADEEITVEPLWKDKVYRDLVPIRKSD